VFGVKKIVQIKRRYYKIITEWTIDCSRGTVETKKKFKGNHKEINHVQRN
jgi:hypothetical protein